jgi:hypothetical protein
MTNASDGLKAKQRVIRGSCEYKFRYKLENVFIPILTDKNSQKRVLSSLLVLCSARQLFRKRETISELSG